jgi:uncharacterized protein YggE
MKRNLLLAGGVVVVALALVLSLVGFSSCGEGPTNIGNIDITSQQEGLWVTGDGKITVTPDLATLYLGVEAKADTVAEAQSQAAEAMDNVMTALTDNGVADKDIQTQYFNISQLTQWDDEKNEEVVIGYDVTNMVTAKIRDMDKVGTIIDAVAKAGGDYIRVNNLAFSVEDPSKYYEEVRQEAMADAKAKAEQLAELSGVELGKPTYISEGSITPPIVYRNVEAVPAPVGGGTYTTSISPGELDVTLSVQVTYAIKD